MNATTATPYGFRVTIERTGRDSFSAERHTFPSKTPRRTYAVQAASYKKGFLRLVEVVPLTREEFDREFAKDREMSTTADSAFQKQNKRLVCACGAKYQFGCADELKELPRIELENRCFETPPCWTCEKINVLKIPLDEPEGNPS